MAAAPHVTPLVKQLAARSGVDLTQVIGTGAGGRIRRGDVDAAARAAAAASTAATPVGPIVGPSNAAETAAALGRRPYDDWFPTVPNPAHITQAQAQWDAQVQAAETQDEYEEREARGMMHLRGGMTFDQALAQVRGRGYQQPQQWSDGLSPTPWL